MTDVKKLTREEFIAKYGDVMVRFRSYYKYAFTFGALMSDGREVCVDTGGNPDDIYRSEVSADEEVAIKDLFPHAGSVRNEGGMIESFYDY